MHYLRFPFVFALIFFIGVFTRLPLIEKYQSHWDGPQYSIAVVRYDLSQETPAPPGYPLYIAAASILNRIFNDPFYSILIVSVIGSGLTAGFLYLAAAKIFNKKTGIISALLALSSPTFYYFGLTAYAYGLIPIFILSLAYTVYCIIFKKKDYYILLGIVTSLSIGFRPQESYSFIPLFILGLMYLPHIRSKLYAVITLIAGMSVWLIPFIIISGGLRHVFEIYSGFAANAVPNASYFYWFNYNVIVLSIFRGLLLTLGLGLIFLVYFAFKLHLVHRYRKYILFFSVWMVPSLLFNLFIRSEHAGYQMGYLSALLILASFAIYKIFYKNKIILWTTVSILIVFNLFWFFRPRDPEFKRPYAPTSFHYSEIRKNDLKLGSKIKYISNNYNPGNTLIITTPDPWRPLMYHLKPYKIYSIDAIYIKNAKYKNIFRISKDWNMIQKNIESRYLVIPADIKYIIFTDDEASSWIKNRDKKIISLPGKSRLTLLSVNNYQKINYSYHSIEFH